MVGLREQSSKVDLSSSCNQVSANCGRESKVCFLSQLHGAGVSRPYLTPQGETVSHRPILGSKFTFGQEKCRFLSAASAKVAGRAWALVSSCLLSRLGLQRDLPLRRVIPLSRPSALALLISCLPGLFQGKEGGGGSLNITI